MVVSSFVWTQYRSATDRQTDRTALASTVLCMVSHADVLLKATTFWHELVLIKLK